MKIKLTLDKWVRIAPKTTEDCLITSLAKAHEALQKRLGEEEMAESPNLWLIAYCRRKMAEAQAILVMSPDHQALLISKQVEKSELSTDESFGLKIKNSIRLQEKA